MRNTIISLLFFVLHVPYIHANVVISRVFPNTTDDKNLEYIVFKNLSCEEVNMSGFTIEDASSKTYTFPDNTIIAPKDTKKLGRPISKIILNNTNETLHLKNTGGVLVDTFGYQSSQKGEVIDRDGIIEHICDNDEQSGNADTSVHTGTTNESTHTGTDSSTNDTSSNTGNTNDHDASTISGSTQTGSTHSGGSLSGTTLETNTGSHNNHHNGSTHTGNTLTMSGTSHHDNHDTVGTFSGKLSATSLGYIDDDNDGYIDTVFLEYPHNLTGNILTGSIALYSATGGLYEHKVNTQTGYIVSGSLSGNRIILNILPSIYKKQLLKIHANTSSELRLKWSADIGVTSASGQTLENIFLTKSFGKYKNIIHPPITSDENISNTGTTSGDSHTGTTISVQFPDIVPTWQRYTNVTLSGDILTCHTIPCRGNMDLRPLFDETFSKRNYTCEVQHNDTLYHCNPPQIYFGSGDTLSIKIIHKASGLYTTRTFSIKEDINPNKKNAQSKKDTNPPIAHILYDGKLRKYHEQIGDHEMNCYTWTCSINLSAERSFDPEGSKLKYIWFYGNNSISTSKDPGSRKYYSGSHIIQLRVLDAAENYAEIFYKIHVLGPKKSLQKKRVKKIKKKKVGIQKKKRTKKRRKKKMKKMRFFDAPKVILQKSKFIKTNQGYVCRTTRKTCSLNLTLSGAMRGITYNWHHSDGTIVTSKNPRSKAFSAGTHTIKVTAGYDIHNPIWRKDIKVTVVRIKKPKKARRSRKTKKGKRTIKNKITKKQELKNSGTTTSPNLPYSTLFFMIGVSPIVFLKKR